MSDKNSNVKDLVINGVLHAKYKIEGDTLYLKDISKHFDEDVLAAIITNLEKVEIRFMSYLNV